MSHSKDQLTLDFYEPKLAQVDFYKPLKTFFKGIKKTTMNMLSVFI